MDPEAINSVKNENTEIQSQEESHSEQREGALPTNWADLIDWDDVLETNKKANSALEKRVGQAVKSAKENEAKRLQLLQDKQLSDEVKFKAMTKDEQIAELRRQKDEAEQRYQREKEAESLRRSVEERFTAKNIPPVFAGIINYSAVSPEVVENIVDMFSEYEFYRAGELERQVNNGVDQRLKQKTPESHSRSGEIDYESLYKKAKDSRNNLEAIRIKREAYEKKGLILL